MTGAGTDKSKPPLTGGPAIVLVRPQLAVNIGMAARAMANFGLSDLRLVAPTGDLTRKDAQAAAAGAVHILEGSTRHATVAEAIGDLNMVWATTARERGQAKRVEAPAAAMPEIAARVMQGEKLGILFGPERTGLENDEVALADAVLTFPVNPAYASLNLAQAVLLVGYEWRRAVGGGQPPFRMPTRSPPAQRQTILAFFEYVEAELERAGFFRPEGKRPVMQRNLRNIFHRMGMTEQDVRTLRGAVVRLVEGPRAEPSRPRRRARRPGTPVLGEDAGRTIEPPDAEA